ncbi:hypothetical protein BLNAU_18582 [Blattamonas nauphoetae]|uniref:Uncharacterized protein n=1 Tax=Blattamonas nauphoetae TaxID=2049346 RepID=A0ABQ9X471_9EUKA|nr:hypothetical protein BLNAU_18582 [Blattamonas nauphoetae]
MSNTDHVKLRLPPATIHSLNLKLDSRTLEIEGSANLSTLTSELAISANLETHQPRASKTSKRNAKDNSLVILSNSTVKFASMLIDGSNHQKNKPPLSTRNRNTQNPTMFIGILDSSSMTVCDSIILSSPSSNCFLVRPSRHYQYDRASTIQIISCKIGNNANILQEIVKLGRGLRNDHQANIFISTSSIDSIAIANGAGISCDVLSHTPPPLFHLETVLSHLVFTNVSTSHNTKPTKEFILSQTLIGSSISHCNNHLSGTTIRDVNLGGSLLAQNTTFSNCHTDSSARSIKSNKEWLTNPKKYKHLNAEEVEYAQSDLIRKQRFLHSTHPSAHPHLFPDPSPSLQLEDITLTFSFCSFSDMTFLSIDHDIPDTVGGAAIHVNRDLPTIRLSNCYFLRCSCSGFSSPSGGAVFVLSPSG